MALGRIALVSVKGIIRETTKEISGIMSISLENAVQNGLIELKAYGGTEQRNLPSGYTEVECLRKLTAATTGRFNTGIIPTVDDVEMEIKVVATSGSWYIFQAQKATSQPIYGISGANSGSKITFNRGDGSVTSSITRTSGNMYYIKATAKNGEGTFYVKDLTNDVEDTNTFTYTFTELDTWVGIFGTQRGTCVANNNKVYFAKMKVAGELVLDCIPAKTDTEVGFYDTVSKTFITPIDGNFEAGPDVTPTPTPDNPIDIVSNNGVIKFSKNMANVNSQTALVGYYISSQGAVTADANNRTYQEFIPCKPNTTYTLSMSSSVYYVTISEYSTAQDSGFVVRKAGVSGGNTKLTITTGANTNYLRFGANLNRTTTATLERVLAINWQLEQGDTPTSYHEYVEGGIYIDGTTETIGLGLTYSTVDGQGNYISQMSGTTTRIYKAFGKLDAGTYTIEVSGPFKFILQYKDAPDTTSYRQWGNIGDWTKSGQYEITDTTMYYGVAITNDSGSGDITPTDFVNGNGKITIKGIGGNVVAEMLLKVGDYQDVQSIIDGVVTRNVGIKVLDGTENWKAHTTLAGWFQLPEPLIYGGIAPALCTHYPYSSIQGAAGVYFSAGRDNPQTNRIIIADNVNFPNTGMLADFKQFLADQYNAGTPVIVIYPLATPTTESVAGQTMNIPDGDSTIDIMQASLNTLSLSAKYKALYN